MAEVTIRAAGADYASTVQAICQHMVTDTAILFELEAPSVVDMARRIASTSKSHTWLMAEVKSEVAGYACGTLHRPRTIH